MIINTFCNFIRCSRLHNIFVPIPSLSVINGQYACGRNSECIYLTRDGKAKEVQFNTITYKSLYGRDQLAIIAALIKCKRK